MRIKIVITNQGEIGFFGNDGTFAQGVTNIQKLLEAIGGTGLKVSEASPIESHREFDQVLATTHEFAHEHE